MSDGLCEARREERRIKEAARVLAHLKDVLEDAHDAVFGLPLWLARDLDDVLRPFGRGIVEQRLAEAKVDVSELTPDLLVPLDQDPPRPNEACAVHCSECKESLWGVPGAQCFKCHAGMLCSEDKSAKVSIDAPRSNEARSAVEVAARKLLVAMEANWDPEDGDYIASGFAVEIVQLQAALERAARARTDKARSGVLLEVENVVTAWAHGIHSDEGALAVLREIVSRPANPRPGCVNPVPVDERPTPWVAATEADIVKALSRWEEGSRVGVLHRGRTFYVVNVVEDDSGEWALLETGEETRASVDERGECSETASLESVGNAYDQGRIAEREAIAAEAERLADRRGKAARACTTERNADNFASQGAELIAFASWIRACEKEPST